MFKAIISKTTKAKKALEAINARYKKYYPTLAMLGAGFIFLSISNDAFAADDTATTIFDGLYTGWKGLVKSGLGKTICGGAFLYGVIRGFKEGLTLIVLSWLGGSIAIAISPELLDWAFKFANGIKSS